MKYINLFLLILIAACQKEKPQQILPPYAIIKSCSEKIQEKANLTLFCYGINVGLTRIEHEIPGIKNFSADYRAALKKTDLVPIDEARRLLVSIGEAYVQQINVDTAVEPLLAIHPMTGKALRLSIFFSDELKINLGQGVAIVTLTEGKIRYKGFNIEEYPGTYPARGKYYTMHEETYEQALEIVNQQNGIIPL